MPAYRVASNTCEGWIEPQIHEAGEVVERGPRCGSVSEAISAVRHHQRTGEWPKKENNVSDHEHSHAPRAQDDSRYGDPVDPARTEELKKELENLPGTIHDTGAVRYYLEKAIKATKRFERNHFLRRKAGAEKTARVEHNTAMQDAIQRAAFEKRQKFNAAPAPTLRMENKWPNGAVLTWECDFPWDDFQVAARDMGRGADGWRGLATKNTTGETKSMIVPERYMSWGDSEPPYELCVMATMNGIGTKLSNVVIYEDPADDDGDEALPVEEIEADADLIAEVQERAAETHHGPVHVQRWQSVLIALGVSEHPGVTAITAAQAEANARRYSSPLWPRIASILKAKEAA